jgi:hypothetical protein
MSTNFSNSKSPVLSLQCWCRYQLIKLATIVIGTSTVLEGRLYLLNRIKEKCWKEKWNGITFLDILDHEKTGEAFINDTLLFIDFWGCFLKFLG